MVDSLQGLRDYLKKYASLIEDRKNNIDTSGAEFQVGMFFFFLVYSS